MFFTCIFLFALNLFSDLIEELRIWINDALDLRKSDVSENRKKVGVK